MITNAMQNKRSPAESVSNWHLVSLWSELSYLSMADRSQNDTQDILSSEVVQVRHRRFANREEVSAMQPLSFQQRVAQPDGQEARPGLMVLVLDRISRTGTLVNRVPHAMGDYARNRINLFQEKIFKEGFKYTHDRIAEILNWRGDPNHTKDIITKLLYNYAPAQAGQNDEISELISLLPRLLSFAAE
jgi:hypothetical protein